MSNYMVAQHQNVNLRMQPQAISGSNLSLSKVTSKKIFVSSDLSPYLCESTRDSEIQSAS